MIKKSDNSQIWLLLSVAFVVAVIASFVTASITGDVIKVKQNRRGPEVYTKAEVDRMFTNLPSGGSGSVSGAATSCDSDAICEIKSAQIQDSFRVSGTPNNPGFYVFKDSTGRTLVESNGPTNIEDLFTANIFGRLSPLSSITILSNANGPGNVLVDGQTTFEKNVEIKAAAYIDDAKIGLRPIGNPLLTTNTLSNDISIGRHGGLYVQEDPNNPNKDVVRSFALQGQGNAYVCVNNVGQIYRSSSPCA